MLYRHSLSSIQHHLEDAGTYQHSLFKKIGNSKFKPGFQMKLAPPYLLTKPKSHVRGQGLSRWQKVDQSPSNIDSLRGKQPPKTNDGHPPKKAISEGKSSSNHHYLKGRAATFRIESSGGFPGVRSSPWRMFPGISTIKNLSQNKTGRKIAPPDSLKIR